MAVVRVSQNEVNAFGGLDLFVQGMLESVRVDPMEVKVKSAAALNALALQAKDNVAVIVQNHGLKALITLADKGSHDAQAHAASACELDDGDLLCAIYATAPFISAEDLLGGLRAMEDSDADYALSVTTFPFPIQRAVRTTKAGRLEMLDPDQAEVRSQDLEEAWHDAGQFYWGRSRAWTEGAPIFSSGSLPVPIPRHRVQDIDTPEDWQRAELMFQALHGRKGGA